jgi:mannose-6-phosphate isomerase-like protein (cupin superfamily)
LFGLLLGPFGALDCGGAEGPSRRTLPAAGRCADTPAIEEHPMSRINLAEKLATFTEHYRPRTVGQFNGHDLMVVKVKGPFVWHRHEDTDDFFLVLEGRLRIELRDGNVELGPGELYVVPKGVEHRPDADEEAHLLLIEPTGTPNTGDAATAAPRVVI